MKKKAVDEITVENEEEVFVRETPLQKQKKFKERIKNGEKIVLLNKEPMEKEEKEWTIKQRYIRSIVSPCYDMQHYRIELGGRICASTYNKLGWDPGQKIKSKGKIIKKEITEEDENDPEAEEEQKKINLLNELAKEYKRITDGFVEKKSKVKKREVRNSEIITHPGELIMMGHYLSVLKSEEDMFAYLQTQLVPTFGPIAEWLLNQYGVKEKLAGVLLAYLNPYRAPHPSNFHSYCGFSVELDGKATSMKQKILKEYVDKNVSIKIKESIKFQKDIKSKLVTCFKQNFIKKKSPWRKRYEEVRYRYEHRPDLNPVKDKNRIFKMTLRVIIKEFLTQLWIVMRKDQGLSITQPITYEAAKLGLTDHYKNMAENI
jgi:hypothetical protein